MSGLHEVDCSGCGRRHVTNGEQARKQRVLRCDCGYFVRLDRALADRRSEPTPPPVEIASVRDDDEDATRMMSSQSAAALIGEGRARSRQPSLVDDERAWRPLDRESAQQAHPSSPAPARPRQHSIAPSEKPLWYVDLGGTELVQMTIEQLILARRGGKLGEGALVWREGMPNWRPVGTLIPAASASAHPAPLPSASSRPAPPAPPPSASSRPAPPAPPPSASSRPAPPPSASSRPAPLASGSSRPAPQPNASTTPTPIRPPVGSAIGTPFPGRVPPARRPPPSNPPPDEGTPRTFASYERPLATLEFALERPEPDRLVRATRSSLPNMDSGASLSRPPTPLPRASLGSVLSTPFPRPGHLPRLTPETTPAPVSPGRRSPPPQPAPLAFASPIPSAAPVRSSDRPNQAALMNLQIADTLSERPRWVSACIALLVCVTASAAGASLVRSLKQRPKPPALPVSAVAAPAVNVAAQKPVSEPARAATSSAPVVVDVESLSVEHKRAVPRAVRAMPKPEPVLSAEASGENSTVPNDTAAAPEAPSAPEAPAEPSNSSDVPPSARSNPYGSGSLIDQIKRATAEEESGQ